jgi:hypothetical protein
MGTQGDIFFGVFCGLGWDCLAFDAGCFFAGCFGFQI